MVSVFVEWVRAQARACLAEWTVKTLFFSCSVGQIGENFLEWERVSVRIT